MALPIAMANLAIAPLVNAKVYRHFAAVTFAITLCVAMFANGEARQVVDEGVANQREASQLRQADAKKFGAKQIGDRRSGIGTRSGFGSDYDPGYGAATYSVPRSISYSPGYADRAGVATGGSGSSPPPEVLSPDEVALLSAEEQSAYVKRLRNQGTAGNEEVVRDLASIEAGSRARSGSNASD